MSEQIDWRHVEQFLFGSDEPRRHEASVTTLMSHWINVHNFHTGEDFDVRITATEREVAALLDIINGPDHIIGQEVPRADA